jgi:hypothetical protein
MQDYPTQPFFVRVITPRCCFYTGHVTAGGSICIEALVTTGGPGGWQVGWKQRVDHCQLLVCLGRFSYRNLLLVLFAAIFHFRVHHHIDSRQHDRLRGWWSKAI